MKAFACLLIALGACGYDPQGASIIDGRVVGEGPIIQFDSPEGIDAAIDARPIDAAPDAPPDAPPPARVQADLIAAWTFDETAAPALDTANFGVDVPLHVAAGAPVFNGGSVTFAAAGRIESNATTAELHLARDCTNNGGATLEVWAMPAAGAQGSVAQPALVAGLSASTMSRDISVQQAGGQWLARVRTIPGMPGYDGAPDLLASGPISTAGMTHLVVVSDATNRTLYVDGVAAVVGTAGALTDWEPYRMTLGNEHNGARVWLGTVGLVAMYRRALTPAEVAQNFAAGPDAPVH